MFITANEENWKEKNPRGQIAVVIKSIFGKIKV